MSNLQAERYIKPASDAALNKVQVGVDAAAVKIWEGAMVTLLTATGMAVRAGTAAAGPCVGVAMQTVDASGDSVDGTHSIDLAQGSFWFANSAGGDEVLAASIGQMVYIVDDQTVADNSNGGARQIAGVCVAIDATDGVLVYISMAHNAYGDATQTTNATNISALQADALTAQYQINVPVATAILAAGTPMAAFADNAGASAPGITLVNSKAVGIRWNNQAGQTAVWYQVAMPQNVDDTAPIVLHALVSKTGATLGDATTLTVSAFFQTVGALHDAGSDVGGTSSAVVGNATAKTVSEITFSISGANLPPSPSGLSFSIKPTDGTLGTDDFIVEALWFEATRKLLAS